MDDLEIFVPSPRKVTVAGTEFAILPLTMRQLVPFAKAIGPVIGLIADQQYLQAALLHPDAARQAVAIATGAGRAFLDGLYPNEFLALAEMEAAAGGQGKAAVAGLKSEMAAVGVATRAAAGQVAGSMQLAAGSLANLTAQFNDIGLMLAAGQNPLQLALQQGTQISQVIGPLGAAGAVKALDTAFMATINPVSLLNLASSRAGPRWCNGRCGRRGRARIPRRWRIGSRRLVMRPKPGKGRRRQRG